MSYGYGWKPYVSAAERRRKAERELAALRKKGHVPAPVLPQGRKLAATFWGKAWNDNLESYSDYANRLPRGRTYVRNGSVIDLQLAGGAAEALVMGSELYRVKVQVAPLPKAGWRAICADCSGSIDSLIELLQGRLSEAVMERVCRQKTGLFPSPAEIQLDCSCPDWASMCKHVVAVMYGIGARLDSRPELVFALRGVDPADLMAGAVQGGHLAAARPTPAKVLDSEDLSALFGLELEGSGEPPAPRGPSRVAAGATAKKPAAAAKKPAAAAKKPAAARRKPVAEPPAPAGVKAALMAALRSVPKSLPKSSPSKGPAPKLIASKVVGSKAVATEPIASKAAAQRAAPKPKARKKGMPKSGPA